MTEATKSRILPLIRQYGLMDLGGASFLVWLVGAYVVLIPSISLIPSLGPYNEKRVLQICLLLILGAVLLSSRATRQWWLSTFNELPRGARWGIGGVLSLGLLSSALAPSPTYAFLELAHFALLFVFSGVVASVVRHSQTRASFFILGVVVASALLYAVYFAVAYGVSLAVADIELWPDGGTNFANIRFFNQYQTVTLPLLGAAFLAVPERRRIVRGTIFGLLSLWWALVFASGVRGTVLAMGVAAVAVGLLFRRRSLRWLRIQATGLLGGGGLYGLLFYLGRETTSGVAGHLDKVGQMARRLELLGDAVQMALTHPWLGVGPMHFAWPPYQFGFGAHPHNAVVQLLAEWGLPATTILLGLLCWGGITWMRQEQEDGRKQRDVAVRVGLVAAVWAGGAHALMSGLIVMPLSQTLLALLLGWAWGRTRHHSQTKVSLSFRGHIALCILLVSSMAVVGGSLRDLTTIRERRIAYAKAVDLKRFSPRYWTQGFFGIQDAEVIERAHDR